MARPAGRARLFEGYDARQSQRLWIDDADRRVTGSGGPGTQDGSKDQSTAHGHSFACELVFAKGRFRRSQGLERGSETGGFLFQSEGGIDDEKS